MIDLKNAKTEDFEHIEAVKKEVGGKQPLHSFIKVKNGSYLIPYTTHKITKLPQGIL